MLEFLKKVIRESAGLRWFPQSSPRWLKRDWKWLWNRVRAKDPAILIRLIIEKGGKVLPDRAAVFGAADIIVQVLCYGSNDVTGKADLPLLRRDQVMIGFLRPFGSAEVVEQIAAAGVTAFSVELVPRTTRAQSMDALSSMGTICGYKAVLLAAETSHQNFSHDDDGGGHHHARARIRDRRRSGGTAGDLDRAPVGRGGFCVRHAPGREGAGAEPRRTIRRASS